MKGICVGEKVMICHKPRPNRMAKLTSPCGHGVYLGMHTVSAEIMVGTRQGLQRARTVQRSPESKRWGANASEMVGGVPLHTSEEDEDMRAVRASGSSWTRR